MSLQHRVEVVVSVEELAAQFAPPGVPDGSFKDHLSEWRSRGTQFEPYLGGVKLVWLWEKESDDG